MDRHSFDSLTVTLVMAGCVALMVWIAWLFIHAY